MNKDFWDAYYRVNRRLGLVEGRLAKLESGPGVYGDSKPETWRDVTGECEADGHIVLHEKAMIHGNPGYRLRKVQFDLGRLAFIIEQRED